MIRTCGRLNPYTQLNFNFRYPFDHCALVVISGNRLQNPDQQGGAGN